MNLIIVEDKELNKDVHIQLELRNNVLFYYGYYYDNGEIKYTSDVKKYFDIFHLSKNSKLIGNSNGYQVYIDYVTGLKHYFKNGKEDFRRLYKYNGVEVTLYEDDEVEDIDEDSKAMRIINKLQKIVLSSYVALALGILVSATGIVTVYSPMTYVNMNRYADNDNNYMSMNMVAERINASTRLNDQEKAFLKNGKFVMDALSYANGTKMDMLLMERLNNIGITGFNKSTNTVNGCRTGYYSYDNMLHILGYDENSNVEDYGEVISHEFAHLFQADDTYRFISEPFASLISYEYFNYEPKGYINELKRIRVLMEIVGSDVIQIYNYTGDINPLRDAVSAYLSPEEVEDFMKTLKVKPSYTDTTEACVKLDKYMEKMYAIKYGESINNNWLISAIYNDGNYTKYYLNSDFINKENCYLTVDFIDTNFKGEVTTFSSPMLERRSDFEKDGTIMSIVYNPNEEMGIKSFSRDTINRIIEITMDSGVTHVLSEEEAIEKGYLVKSYVYFDNFDICTLIRERPNEIGYYYIFQDGDTIPLRQYIHDKTTIYLPTIYEQFGEPSRILIH